MLNSAKSARPFNRPSLRNVVYDFLACAIIILFHFSNYVFYTEYDRIYPDILIIGAGLCGLAVMLTAFLQLPSRVIRSLIFSVLITFVIGDALFEFGTKDDFSLRLIALSVTLLAAIAVLFFLRENAPIVLIGGFLAMLISTVSIGLWTVDTPAHSDLVANQPNGNGDLPLVVHIILDEQIGLAGMKAGVPGDDAAAEQMRNFYTNAGFRIFAGAYSQFFRTETSLAGALNFDLTATSDRFLTRKHYGFSLNKNSYLKSYADKGYRVRVYQSDYLDMCQSQGIKVESCTTYRPDFLARSAIEELPASERLHLLFSMYYSSITLIKIIKLTGVHLGNWASGRGIELPQLNLWHGRVGPIAVVPTFDQLIQDISRARARTVFFAHFLMPHYPYVYRADCTVRIPVSSWRLRHDKKPGSRPESRVRSYTQYFDQIQCVQKRLERLFETMKRSKTFNRATIVIHGDHGSRIALASPDAATITKLTPTDYADAYSTLFVVKSPDIRPGVDLRMLPLAALMSYAQEKSEAPLSVAPSPTVFIDAGEPVLKSFPLPRFPALPPQ